MARTKRKESYNPHRKEDGAARKITNRKTRKANKKALRLLKKGISAEFLQPPRTEGRETW